MNCVANIYITCLKPAISEVREDGVSGRGSGREKVEEGEEFEVRGIFERQVSVAGPAR